ncbi:uncharacterized protein [Primulina eburnea]|uniref:uncharacterized protein isoform X3 n=1 Tax=Primulina eburnea TaxID=1245227 RepID=UPI003C6CBD05
MKSIFRSVICTKFAFSVRVLNPIPQSQPCLLLPRNVVVFPAQRSSHVRSMSGGESGINVLPSPNVRALENQFEELRHQLEDTGDSRERIRNISREIESTTRLMHYSLLLIHQSQPVPVKLLEFGLDVEDYLVGICFMSNELPRYVVNQVTAGDYDCPRKVLKFLTDLHAAFRMLNLRNDFLRKKFDGMKYDLKRVEEVYYDVKIRGLATNGDSAEDPRQT